ncbi:MAG: SET domain-containing protein-lysine N-methyltransferase [Saprospiraceae bacterium]|nr:SET domain-containing protein-lysine N-methyltransferase [Saprospiraceae bacterium]
MSMHIPSLYIAPSPKAGRGVFTSAPIEPDDVIEICPVIIVPEKDVPLIHQTYLHDYYFLWENKQCAIALGYGSLYNHSPLPNAEYYMDYDNQAISVYCIRPIQPGEEITISYTDEGDERTKLWFDVQE